MIFIFSTQCYFNTYLRILFMYSVVPESHKKIFDLLKTHLKNIINGSAYNWVRPSIWTSVFKTMTNATTNIVISGHTNK
jgi:hypothetical protein